jgi:hypothetical protein
MLFCLISICQSNWKVADSRNIKIQCHN